MRILAGPNTNALRSITGYNAGSPLRMGPTAAISGAQSLSKDIGDIASDNIQAQSAKGEGGRILGETGKYAAMGAMVGGPIGAGVGALVGLTVGLVKNKKAKEAYAEEQEEITKQTNAANARATLNANVNMAKQQGRGTQSNITKMEHEDKAPTMMSHLKMSHLKKGYSTLQMGHESKVQMGHSELKKSDLYNNHYSDMKKLAPLPYGSEMKMSAKDHAASDMMMKVSGVSSLTRTGVDPETGVVYPGLTAATTPEGTRYLKSETSKSTVYDDGSKSFNTKYTKATYEKNKALDTKEKQEKAAAEAAKQEQLKKDTAAANERAKANVESNK